MGDVVVVDWAVPDADMLGLVVVVDPHNNDVVGIVVVVGPSGRKGTSSAAIVEQLIAYY